MRAIVFLFFIPTLATAQKWKKYDKTAEGKLKEYISYLADDKLEGRRAGTPGEQKAASFIADAFSQIGLSPKGTEGYFQPFSIDEGRKIKSTTFFEVGGKALKAGIDFYPLSYSPDAKLIESASSIALSERGAPWFVDIQEGYEENINNPHFDIDEWIKTKAKYASSKGAPAILLYFTGKGDEPSLNGKDKSEKSIIPIVYVKKNTVSSYFPDRETTYDYKFRIETETNIRKSKNVVGYIDNDAATTVVVGAHFDHLGFGEDGNSMLRTTEKLIHNGADDNASGTAGLLLLADVIKKEKVKKHNFLFIAFSAEELGLLGSKYFVENPTVELSKVSYMINMDMIGRMNDSTNSITVGGFGTSPAWSSAITPNNKSAISFKVDSSGTGPSDHTSFYRKDIPVLFFFTGIHGDYHKPSDDWEKINYKGEWSILKFAYSIINHPNTAGKIPFLKTREQAVGSSTRFSVSMGIMPDYTFSGYGVRVDGVSEGKPAQAVGIKAGDIVT
ncbi:MAG: M20/M25/M40 family metallo-hydrolase, partial [Bacteroidota bacterium]